MTVLSVLAAACGDLALPKPKDAVIIEPAAPTPTAAVRAGGKPAAPAGTPAPTLSGASGNGPESSTLAATAVRGEAAALSTRAQTAASSLAPTEGRWIDVDVSNFVVHLMNGTSVVREIGPVAVGTEVDTGNFTSTQTGLFHVYNKIAGLQYDAPYDSYIGDWVGFDIDKQNGFHSFLKDKTGNDTVTSTGRVSNGCIRTAAASDIFAFADIGMPVLVHT